MPKYQKKPITVEAVQLLYPTAITKPTGIEKGIAGDYIISAGDEQFIIPKKQFDMTYQITAEPDTIAPMEVSNLLATDVQLDSFTISFETPYDADFTSYKIYVDGLLVVQDSTTGLISYSHTGLTSATTYAVKVSTVDRAGNESTGTTISITTL